MEKYHFLISWSENRAAGRRLIGKNIEIQLIKLIAREYRQGNYSEDVMMPSVRILAKLLGVRRYLVERAYAHWIERKEILYALDRQGTFMYSRSVKKTAIAVATAAQFSFERKSSPNSAYPEHQNLNILTLGNTYPLPSKDELGFLDHPTAGELHVRPSFFLKDTLGILRKRKLINHQRQFCIIPHGRAVYKVLKMIASPEDLMVMTTIDDFPLVELATQLRLNLAFSGTDEQGMSAIKLEEICQHRPVSIHQAGT